MRDLIAANFRRMFKNNLFWGCVLFMFFVAVVELVSSKIEALSGGGSAASSVLDSLLYHSIQYFAHIDWPPLSGKILLF